MSSIRRTLLVWLLAGLAAIARRSPRARTYVDGARARSASSSTCS